MAITTTKLRGGSNNFRRLQIDVTLSSTGTSTAIESSAWSLFGVQVILGGGTITFTIEGSNDGTNYSTISAAPISSGTYDDTIPWNWIRLNISASSGSPIVIISFKE